jgi:RNA polymerase sigma factor (sigma-70 family)
MVFDTLVKKLSPTLKRITVRLNGRFTFMDHDDLFQEALIHLWVHTDAGDLDDKTDSYILQGCYFHLKNYIRKTQDNAVILSLSGITEEDGSPMEESLVSDEHAAFDYVEGTLQIEALEATGMSEREKRVLHLSIEGMTTREIGKELGISHVSVVKMRNKIKEHFECLNGNGFKNAGAEAASPTAWSDQGADYQN